PAPIFSAVREGRVRRGEPLGLAARSRRHWRHRAGRGSGGPRLRPAARRRMSGARARALVALLALVTARGRVGPPLAPERRPPLPPTALSLTTRAGEYVLSWPD